MSVLNCLNFVLSRSHTIGIACCLLASSLSATEHVSQNKASQLSSDPNCFTQGLVVHRQRIYVSCGLYGNSKLQIRDITTGAVLREKSLSSQWFAEGISVLDDRLFMLTWRENIIVQFDSEDLTEIRRFRRPGEGWGLTTDGQNLILSDGSANLVWLEPSSMQVRKLLRVTDQGRAVPLLNELEWINGLIYANVWHSDQVLVINPSDGTVLERLNFKHLRPNAKHYPRAEVLNGIAWDRERSKLLLTGKRWPYIHLSDLP